VTEGASSGVAMILVDRKGENSIIVAPGANARLTPKDIDVAADVIRGASAVVMQLEIPADTVRHALAVCRRHGVYTILDPAPVPPKGLPREMLAVDVLTPNQGEAEALLAARRSMGRMKRTTRVDAKQLGSDLLAMGPRSVVLKLGRRGAMLVDGDVYTERGFKVDVTDTTAAGDAFTAALAVGHTEGVRGRAAVRFANAAGALCCEGFGAQPSLPGRDAVDALLARGNPRS